ncbi:TPA: HNH endonuclease [Candidatus Woesearchaeota archaeon]|nr:HNH endonuclease [Candidatus Woesearchaeota archaeon]
MVIIKQLYLSYTDPDNWRNSYQTDKLKGIEWNELRSIILERDNFTCVYCGYKSEKYQIVDHINGNPENNDYDNLQVVCQMCNLIKHSGQGCEIKGVVDLYRESKYNQNTIMKITRKMRDEGASDVEIINVLGLRGRMPFKMNLDYLKRFIGFVTSREIEDKNDMYYKWLQYHKKEVVSKVKSLSQKTIFDCNP